MSATEDGAGERVPECVLGYPRAQIAKIVGDRLDAFDHWMRGQTAAICDGKRYDHEAREYQPTGCGPHGVVIYPWDVENFLNGGPICD